MSARRNLLSALAALTVGSAPVAAADLTASAGQHQEALAPMEPAAARSTASSGADPALANRLAACLKDGQLAAEGDSLSELVWRNARSLECLTAVQLVQVRERIQVAEIY